MALNSKKSSAIHFKQLCLILDSPLNISLILKLRQFISIYVAIAVVYGEKISGKNFLIKDEVH